MRRLTVTTGLSGLCYSDAAITFYEVMVHLKV